MNFDLFFLSHFAFYEVCENSGYIFYQRSTQEQIIIYCECIYHYFLK
jgi:hypothetical protein